MISSDQPMYAQIPEYFQNTSADESSGWFYRTSNSTEHATTTADIAKSHRSMFGINADPAHDGSHGRRDIPTPREADVNVQADVERRLVVSSCVAFRGIDCEFHAGILVLRGNVPSFHTKQLAQAIARKVNGVSCIVNRLSVDQSRLSDALRIELPFHSIGTCPLVSE